MSDEFPTLEVALAAGVAVLLWRGWLLRQTRLARDLPHADKERTTRLRHRVRSAAARDLVICGVLAGSLLYVLSSNIVRGWPFFALGGTATLLLLAAVAERLRLDRELARIGSRFGSDPEPAAKGRAHAGTRAERGGTAEPSACNVCGAPDLEPLTEESELGPKLWALGTRELFVCARCGHVSGNIPREAGPTDPRAESASDRPHGKGP